MFGTLDFTNELCTLAVEYLREHKVDYENPMIVYLNDRRTNLVRLQKSGKIDAPDYDGYLKAIEMGEEWGNDLTLRAMAILLHRQVRLLHNLPCNPSDAEPRLLPIKIDSSCGQVGVMSSVIYLFLQGEHYSTLENGAAPAPPAPSVPVAPQSEYSVKQGSIHTDPDSDITGWGKDPYAEQPPIRIDGVEYDARDLLGNGTSIGDGKRLVMKPSDDGKEWVIYCVWGVRDACSWKPLDRGQNGSREEMRRLPRKVKQGPTKRRKKPPSIPQPPPMVSADSTGCEGVENWQLELQRTGWQATSMVAQRLFDCIDKHVKELELELFTGDADDHTPLALISSEVLAIREKLRKIKFHLNYTASEHSLPIQSVMVVGNAGVGKSTTINHVIQHSWKVPEDQAAEAQVAVVQDELFRAGAPISRRQEEVKSVAEEEAAALDTAKNDEFYYDFKTGAKDVLPAGSGDAMTALPTNVFFDPLATQLQLHITYCLKSKVDEVLKYGEMIRNDVDGQEEAQYDDVKAAHATVLLGITTSSVMSDGDEKDALDDPVVLLKRYKGSFTLPARFSQLLGSEPTKRIFTIVGGDRPDDQGLRPAAKKLQDLMLLHTIGHWSHWPVRAATACAPLPRMMAGLLWMP